MNSKGGCGGSLTARHDGLIVRTYRLAPRGEVRRLCEPCRDYARSVGLDPK